MAQKVMLHSPKVPFPLTQDVHMVITASSVRTLSMVALGVVFAWGIGGADPQVRADDRAVADKIVAKAAAALYEGIRTQTLPNGLRVFLKPISGSPVVTSMVAYK